MLALLAQAVEKDSARWAEYGVLGAISFVLLGAVLRVLWHVLNSTIPEMTRQHGAVLEKLVTAFSTEQREGRTLFREEAKNERDICERRHQENLTVQSARHDELVEALIESRHTLKNLEHSVQLHMAVIDQAVGRKPLRSDGGGPVA